MVRRKQRVAHDEGGRQGRLVPSHGPADIGYRTGRDRRVSNRRGSRCSSWQRGGKAEHGSTGGRDGATNNPECLGREIERLVSEIYSSPEQRLAQPFGVCGTAGLAAKGRRGEGLVEEIRARALQSCGQGKAASVAACRDSLSGSASPRRVMTARQPEGKRVDSGEAAMIHVAGGKTALSAGSSGALHITTFRNSQPGRSQLPPIWKR